MGDLKVVCLSRCRKRTDEDQAYGNCDFKQVALNEARKIRLCLKTARYLSVNRARQNSDGITGKKV